MIRIPDTATLTPQAYPADNRIVYFPSASIDLVKIDFLFVSGTFYQPQLLCASAASKLYTLATERMDSASLAEFMDFRGVVIETGCEFMQSTLTVYLLRRYVDEVLGVVNDMFRMPAFDSGDFATWQAKRHEEIATYERRTSLMARRIFYWSLFGAEHPLGRYATADDVYRLGLEGVRSFWQQRYDLGKSRVVAAGSIDGQLLTTLSSMLNGATGDCHTESGAPMTVPAHPATTVHLPIEGATQTSLRVGRILPLDWDSMDYARFTLLVTALGGYFGSRLMSNLREDKGYTYGIYARTQIYRGAIVFYIAADVAAGTSHEAVKEIMRELRRLREEPMGAAELEMVKTVLAGDFIRSVEGVFELSGRHVDMVGTAVDERFTDNLRTAIEKTTAAQLQELAQRLLVEDDMTVATAGV